MVKRLLWDYHRSSQQNTDSAGCLMFTHVCHMEFPYVTSIWSHKQNVLSRFILRQTFPVLTTGGGFFWLLNFLKSFLILLQIVMHATSQPTSIDTWIVVNFVLSHFAVLQGTLRGNSGNALSCRNARDTDFTAREILWGINITGASMLLIQVSLQNVRWITFPGIH